MLNPTRPFFYLLAYVAVLYLRPQEFIGSLEQAPVVPVVLLLAALFWMLAQQKRFEAPQHGILIGLTICMSLSVAATGWLGGAVTAITEFVPTMLLFYLVATSVDSIKRFRYMGMALVAISVVLALHGIGQIGNEEGIGWTGAKTIEGRITYLGILNDPNDLSMAFLISLPFDFYLARTARWKLMRMVYIGSAALTLYGIFLCNSRGAILALLTMLVTYSIRRFGLVKSLVMAPLLLAPVLILGPNRMDDMSVDEESAAGRIDSWYEGFLMFRQHPLLGVGKGLFTEHHYLTAHNSYILSIAELGVIGYFFWFAFFAVTALMLYRLVASADMGDAPAPASKPEYPYSHVPVASVADAAPEWKEIHAAARTLAYAFIGAMVSVFFLSRSYIPFLYLLAALVVAIYQMVRRHWPAFQPITFGPLIGKLLMLEFASIVFLWGTAIVLLRFA